MATCRGWLWAALLLVALGPARATDQVLELGNRHYRIALDLTRPGLRAVENRHLTRRPALLSAAEPQPLFALHLREAGGPRAAKPRSWSLTSRDFRTARVARAASAGRVRVEWHLVWAATPVQVRVCALICSDTTPESVWELSLHANRELDAVLTFPILDGLQVGLHPDRAAYFHPRWAGILNDAPADLASVYGQYVRMQVMGAYAPASPGQPRAAGVYLVTRDRTMMRKTYELVKRVPGARGTTLRDDYGFPFWSGFRARSGIGMAVSWLRLPLRAGRTHLLPPVAIGIGPGDWRTALDSYARWARTWCPPHARSARGLFQHASFPLFDYPSCDAALAELDRHPNPDYLQFMVQKTHVNGEYGYREDWGLDEIRRFVRECRRRGIRTNHYVEGYIVSANSRVWKERGMEWGQMAGGKFQTAFANQCMWLGWPDWHRWLAGETTRLARDLDLDSLYLDEIGFGTGDKMASDNPRHRTGRLQEDGAMTGARRLLATVRRALDQVDPRIALYTEGPAVDALFPFLDGVEDYSCRQWHTLPEAYRVPVHFLRFVFPDFTFADIPIGTQAEVDRQVRQCLFNGIGTFTAFASADPADWLERAHVIERENRDAFTDPRPVPLVPTLHEGVYCNRFSASGKVVLTLFNANDYPVSGQVLSLLRLPDGWHWVDLLRLAAAHVQTGPWGRRAVLGLEPGGVAVLGAVPARLEIRRHGERVWLSGKSEGASDRLALALVDRSDLIREQRPWMLAPEGLSLAEATDMGRHRAALKLYREGVLTDLLPLPDLPSLDLAEDATVTGSVASGGRDPRCVNGGRPGAYAFNWDDKERWVQLTWEVPQTLNTCELRCTESVYSPQRYTYYASDDGKSWMAVAEVNREGRPDFAVRDTLSRVSTRFLRLVIQRGGPWGDHVELLRWRVRCVPRGP